MSVDTLRYPLALLGGLVFATLMFMVMQWLLLRPSAPAGIEQAALLVERVQIREPTRSPNPPPQKLPQPKQLPKRPAMAAPSPAVSASPVALTGPSLSADLGKLSIGVPVARGQVWGSVDASLVILSRIEPVYPPVAARRGIEGWVRLQFSVGPDGQVRDAVVVEAQPPNLFDRAALRAVQQWRFKARRTNGKAVATSVTQTLKFTLDS